MLLTSYVRTIGFNREGWKELRLHSQ